MITVFTLGLVVLPVLGSRCLGLLSKCLELALESVDRRESLVEYGEYGEVLFSSVVRISSRYSVPLLMAFIPEILQVGKENRGLSWHRAEI